jgi:hypothetical protein
MSQSDYIQYKKIGVQLKNRRTDPSILPSSQYLSYMDYNIELTTPSTSINFGRPYVASNITQLFDMKLSNAVNCPTYSCIGGYK